MSQARKQYLEFLERDIFEIEAMATEPMLQFFGFGHLPAKLQEISSPFANVAEFIVNALPRNPERTAALRKLLEAKDCAVRAALYKD